MDSKQLHDILTQQNLLIGKSLQNAQPPSPMVKPEDINKDFENGEVTDEQQGEQAGNEAVNAAIPEANSALKSGQKFQNEVDRQDFMNMDYDQKNQYLQDQANQRNPAAADFSSGAPIIPNNPPGLVPPPVGDLGLMKNAEIKVPGAPKVTPVNQPELSEGAKANIKGGLNQANENMGSIQDMAQITAENEKGQAAFDKKTNEEKAQLEMERAKPFLDVSAKSATLAQEASNRFNDEINKMTQIDPSRVWNNSSTFGKIGFLLSAAAGGLESGQPLANVIQNDLMAQQKDLQTRGAKAQNFLGMIYKYTGNQVQAMNIASDAYKRAIDASMLAAQSGYKMTPEHLSKVALDYATQAINNQNNQKYKYLGFLQSQQKMEQEAENENNKNKLEAAKINQEKAKIENEIGKIEPEQALPAVSFTNASRNLNKLKQLEMSGVDPSSAEFQSFAKTALSSGLGNQAMTYGVSIGIPQKKVSRYLDYLRATQNVMRDSAEEEGKMRALTPDQVGSLAQTNMARFIDNEESRNSLRKEAEERNRARAVGFSDKTRRILFKNAPYTIDYLRKPGKQ